MYVIFTNLHTMNSVLQLDPETEIRGPGPKSLDIES